MAKRTYKDLSEKETKRIIRSALRLYKQWSLEGKEVDDEIYDLCISLEKAGLCAEGYHP